VRSLAGRLAWVLGLAAGGIALALFLSILVSSGQLLRGRLDARVQAVAAEVSTEMERAAAAGERPADGPPRAGISWVVAGGEGQLLARSTDLLPEVATALAAATRPDADRPRRDSFGGATWRTAVGQAVPSAAWSILAATPTEPLDGLRDTLLSRFALASLCGVALLAGLSIVVVRRGVRPLADLASRLGDVDAESLERRIPAEDLPTELRQLAHQANALFDRLDEAFERERRTTSNIAHELRTPIAELRGLTEVAMRLTDDADFARKTVAEAYAIAVEMDRIATTLLRVARAQAGQLEVRRQRLTADETLRAAVATVVELAQRRAIEVEVLASPEVEVQADPDLLDLILVNLLTNAAQHAPDGDRVTCAVQVDGEAVEFVIENTNVGLLPEDMEHLTETFWKKDAARKDPVHTGLGLALVDQLAETCGFEFGLTLVGDRVRATVRIHPPPPPRPETGGTKSGRWPRRA
jgi:signal transduction histidine kinase